MNRVIGCALAAAALGAGERQAEPAATEAAPAPAAAPGQLQLNLYQTAVGMTRPVLPARIAGDCPGPDPCEFGTKWQTCQDLPLYAEAASGARTVRMLKPMEKFTAESGEIELLGPGQIEILEAAEPGKTGGIAVPRTTLLEVYGPLQTSRALYYDPNSGRGWSPEPASDHWWWDGKQARMLSAPIMTWWVKAKLDDGTQGWIKLKSDEDKANFPIYSYDEALLSWNVEIERDDESPDCRELLAERARNDPTL